uniref:Uncharacterized protein AlNc14C131G6967 n=1 Tax=Albugo laibachii Nc14 TaxID=890382 RepID=F0WKB4_9STRA|nr:conserved hypothetical protein [Albugo laibachii Nc14]CCA21857.1 conserved hypothetical protein [Albugo laibachii Nc14]|eukprot:CCA21857.1 conserved hypothetical protein [Albugo laibachii Nc14]
MCSMVSTATVTISECGKQASSINKPRQIGLAFVSWKQPRTPNADKIIEKFLFMLVLSVYMNTLYPSIPGGDSGELVAESCHLGVAHPPGYPLYILIHHACLQSMRFLESLSVISKISPAVVANSVSALCDTFTTIFLFRSILIWITWPHYDPKRIPLYAPTAAAIAAGLFAFSPLIWTYAVSAEVFALNNLLAGALLHILVRYGCAPRFRAAISGAFLCGIALCNQHTIILMELPIMVWVLRHRFGVNMQRGKMRLFFNELLSLFAAFVAGLSLYLYLPLTAVWNPQPGSWGHVSSLGGLWHHLRRGDYGTFRLFSTLEATEGVWQRIRLYFCDLHTNQGLYVVIPVALIGVVSSLCLPQIPKSVSMRTKAQKSAISECISKRDVALLITVSYICYILGFHALSNLPLNQGLTYGVHMRFWQQPNILVFFFVGEGLWRVLKSIADHSTRLANVLSLGCTALVLIQLYRWYFLMDQSESWYVRRYARALLNPLPRRAILIVNYDLQWTSLRYLQQCEMIRKDVILLNLSMMTYWWFDRKRSQYPSLVFPGSRLTLSSGEGFTFLSFLNANLVPNVAKNNTRIFFSGRLSPYDRGVTEKYQLVPYGMTDEIIIKTLNHKKSLHRWYRQQRKVRRIMHKRLKSLPSESKYDDKTWEWTIARDYRMRELHYATYLLEQSIAMDPQNLRFLCEATYALEYSYLFEPEMFRNPLSTLKNLGLGYAHIVKANSTFDQFGVEQDSWQWPKRGFWRAEWVDMDQPRDPFAGNTHVLSHGRQSSNKPPAAVWKDCAARRMLHIWGEWLKLEGADLDPGFATIKRLVPRF